MAADKKYADSAAMKLPTELPLKEYQGNYFNNVYGNMTIVNENNELSMKFSHHPNMYASLSSLAGNRFTQNSLTPFLARLYIPLQLKMER